MTPAMLSFLPHKFGHHQRSAIGVLAFHAALVIILGGCGDAALVVRNHHRCSLWRILRFEAAETHCAAGARLQLRGGGDLGHLLPDIEESESSQQVDWDTLTDQEKKEHVEDKEYEDWKDDYISNFTLQSKVQPYTQEDEQSMHELLLQQRKLRRLLDKHKLSALRSNRGPKAEFMDDDGVRKSLIDKMDPTFQIPRDEIKDADSSEDTPLPDPRDKDATLEYMFEKILNLQRKNEDEKRFKENKEEDFLKGRTPKSSKEDRLETRFEDERRIADHIIDAPFKDSDGVLHNITGCTEEFLNRHHIYSLPVTLHEDFELALAECEPSADTALEAWEMFKGKDLEGFDTICLRHKKWGTEVEIFIGSIGTFKCRPSPLHQITTVEVDGSWFEWKSHYEKMDAPHIFEHLWSRCNLTDDESNVWRHGAHDWVEAMGGADSYLSQGR